MDTVATGQSTGSKPKMKRSIIDCDIHIPHSQEDVLSYWPRHYRDQIATFGMRLPGQPDMYLNGAKGGIMQDQHFPKDGKTESILKYFQKEHLDKYDIE